jgi:hypothetical protein
MGILSFGVRTVDGLQSNCSWIDPVHPAPRV